MGVPDTVAGDSGIAITICSCTWEHRWRKHLKKLDNVDFDVLCKSME